MLKTKKPTRAAFGVEGIDLIWDLDDPEQHKEVDRNNSSPERQTSIHLTKDQTVVRKLSEPFLPRPNGTRW